MTDAARLLAAIRGCRLCEDVLPVEPRPVLQIHRDARILVASQAPGRAVHRSGVPFDDASGDRLRSWLGVSRQEFYDPRLFALVPMAFCYPGAGASGDLPPRPECAVAWRSRVLAHLPEIDLTLVVGRYANDNYAKSHAHDEAHDSVRERAGPKSTLSDAVSDWRAAWPSRAVLPHPSPRNRHWLTRHPEFEQDRVPALRRRVRAVIDASRVRSA